MKKYLIIILLQLSLLTTAGAFTSPTTPVGKPNDKPEANPELVPPEDSPGGLPAGVVMVKRKRKFVRTGTYIGYGEKSKDKLCWIKVLEKVEEPGMMPFYKVVISDEPESTYEITYLSMLIEVDGEPITHQSVLKNGKDISSVYATHSLNTEILDKVNLVSYQLGIQLTESSGGPNSGDIQHYNFARLKGKETEKKFDAETGKMISIFNVDTDNPEVANSCTIFKYDSNLLEPGNITLETQPELVKRIERFNEMLKQQEEMAKTLKKQESEMLEKAKAELQAELDAKIAKLKVIDPSTDAEINNFVELLLAGDKWLRECRPVGKFYFDESSVFTTRDGGLFLEVNENTPKFQGNCGRFNSDRYKYKTKTNYKVEITGKSKFTYKDTDTNGREVIRDATVLDVTLRRLDQNMSVLTLGGAKELKKGSYCGRTNWLDLWLENSEREYQVDVANCSSDEVSFGKIMIKNGDLYTSDWFNSDPDQRSKIMVQEAYIRNNKPPEPPKDPNRFIYLE